MRVSAAVASCIGVGLVLQGCGEGESNDKGSSCLAKDQQMDIVSQSMSGTFSMTIDATLNGDELPPPSVPLEADFVSKLDFEKMNSWEQITAKNADGETMVVTLIASVENKQVIAHVDAGKAGKKCAKEDLPEDVAELPLAFQALKPMIAKQAKCQGNDGTYDTWKFSTNYTGGLNPGGLPMPDIPDLPVPLPPQFQNISLEDYSIKDGLVSEELEMSPDHLLHSSTTSVSGELLNETEPMGSLTMKVTMTVKEATKGGPSKDDLDESQFKGVKCEKIDPSDILPGFAHKQFLRFVKAAKNSEHALVV